MHFEDAVRHLAACLGAPSLTPDTSGAVALAWGDVVINLRSAQDGECFTLDSRLGSMQSATPDTLVAMMTENRWPMVSTEGVLGIDCEGFAYLFLRIKESQLLGTRLDSLLQRFARRAMLWRQRIRASGAAPINVPQASAPGYLAGVLA